LRQGESSEMKALIQEHNIELSIYDQAQLLMFGKQFK